MTDIKLFPTKITEINTIPEKIPYGVNLTKAPEIWHKKSKGSGVVIAVLDSGCDINHPDLKESIIEGYNFTDDNDGDVSLFNDYVGHGTHVAGIISANENGAGLIGVAPESKLLILKVINRQGIGTYESLINAVDFAKKWRSQTNEKVSIMNISLGGKTDDPTLYSVIKQAINEGIIIVASGGNNGDNNSETNEVIYPAAYKEVIQVGAVDSNLCVEDFSNSNKEVDFVAPGSEILSTHLKGSYARLTGTSMAAPHVAGAVALILNQKDEYGKLITSEEVYKYLSLKAKPLGYHFFLEGHGLIQLV